MIPALTKDENLMQIKMEQFVLDLWEAMNDHEKRIRSLEVKLKDLKERLERKKQVHHLGRVHEF